MIKFTLLLAALFLPQAAERHVIQGSIAIENGFVDTLLLVRLENSASHVVDQTVATSASGFTFRDIPAGTYYVRVRHESFEDALERVDVPGFSRSLHMVMSRKKDAPSPKRDNVLGSNYEVNLRQLSVSPAAVREYRKALEKVQKGDIAGAVQRLNRAINISTEFSEAYTALAKIYLKNNDLEAALTALNHAARLDSTSLEAAFFRGYTLYGMDRYEEAEEALIQAHRIDPNQPQVRLMLANVFVRQKKFQNALFQLDAYLHENPDGPDRLEAERMRLQLTAAGDK